MSRTGTTKPPVAKGSKHRSVNSVSGSNPFDSDSDNDQYPTAKPLRTSSEPVIPTFSNNPFDDHGDLTNDTKNLQSTPYESPNRSKVGFVAQMRDKAASVGESARRTVGLWGKNNSDDSKLKQVLDLQQREELFSVNNEREASVSSSSTSNSILYAARNQYKNDFKDSGGLESQSVQELENYAVYKSEETTETVNSCLKIAHDIREDATKTLITLHQQGEQITRTHMTAVDIDQDLSRGEKLLGSLGGIFSKTWKPKKTRPITGPVITKDDSFKRRGSHLDQRQRLGLQERSPRGRSNPRQNSSEPASAQERIQTEKAKQDDSLLDLSNLLTELKGMAVDMGTEIGRQNHALDSLDNDAEELNYRVKGANQRGRRLLGK